MGNIVMVSPGGNPEVWPSGSESDLRAKGYVTQEEWAEAHPRPDPEPVTPTRDDLSLENQRRLDLSKLGQEVERKVVTGEDINPDVLTYREACIAAYKALEAMNPPPSDYMDDKYWPDLPA